MAYAVLLNVRSRSVVKSEDLKAMTSLAVCNEIAAIISPAIAQRDERIRYALNIEVQVVDRRELFPEHEAHSSTERGLTMIWLCGVLSGRLDLSVRNCLL